MEQQHDPIFKSRKLLTQIIGKIVSTPIFRQNRSNFKYFSDLEFQGFRSDLEIGVLCVDENMLDVL